MRIGDLVTFRGSIGLVIGKVDRTSAGQDDVWVLWNDEPNAKWEYGPLLEIVCK